MKLSFLVLARDEVGVAEKISALEKLGYDFRVVCGAKMELPKVYHREPLGKFDAINVGMGLLDGCEVVCLNDVDTQIVDFDVFLREFELGGADLYFSRVKVNRGPQLLFYKILDLIRLRTLVAASGELMLVKLGLLQNCLPIPPCKAEDTYLLFKAMELGYNVSMSSGCHIVTRRTQTFREEVAYKKRTTLGVYQALTLTKPYVTVRLFYLVLPSVAWTLVLFGRAGLAWAAGIYLGIKAFVAGDRTGAF